MIEKRDLLARLLSAFIFWPFLNITVAFWVAICVLPSYIFWATLFFIGHRKNRRSDTQHGLPPWF